MDKRYQVFVSSTFRDLTEERQQVMQALLELNCIPAGMELFPASNDDQWTLIKRVIDDCDYYIVIIAGRYGSTGEAGISFTEMEYDHAVSIGKPVMAFIREEPGEIAAAKTDMDSKAQKKLAAFRAKAEKRMAKYWRSPEDLGGKVSRSLIQLTQTHPAEGWVKARHAGNPDELLRLRRTIEELQSRLAHLRTEPPEDASDLQQGEDKLELTYKYQPDQKGGASITSTVVITWDDAFQLLGPMMFDPADEKALADRLTAYVTELARGSGTRMFNIRFNIQQFHRIKVQFLALGLIRKHEWEDTTSDGQTRWTLTPYGQIALTRLMAARRITAPAEQTRSVRRPTKRA